MLKAKRDYLSAATLGAMASVFLSFLVFNLRGAISNIINISSYSYLQIFLFVLLFIVTLCLFGVLVGRLIGKKSFGIYQFAKFGETGGLNFAVDFGILNLLILLTGIEAGLFYTLFKAISFIFAVSNSYMWNKFWVFKNQGEKDVSGGEMFKFFTISVIGLLLNATSASLVVYLGPSLTNLGGDLLANLGALVGSLLVIFFNFFGYKLLVFTKGEKKKDI